MERGRINRRLIALLALFLAAVGASAEAQAEQAHELTGLASWYAGRFQGRQTASGEVFDTNLLTAAHKTLPFDTVVRVTHLGNGRSVDVRINDRGPFVEGRVIDLSRAAADAIGMAGEGIAPVELVILAHPDPPQYRIQVASFGNSANARRTSSQLARANLSPSIEEAGEVYRVVLPGLNADEIPPLRARLAELGFHSVLVRRE